MISKIKIENQLLSKFDSGFFWSDEEKRDLGRKAVFYLLNIQEKINKEPCSSFPNSWDVKQFEKRVKEL